MIPQNWNGHLAIIVSFIIAFLLAVYAHRRDLQRFFSGNELTIREAMAKHGKK